MESTGRIILFTPDVLERQQLKWLIEEYIKKNFNRYNSKIDIQEFDSFYRPRGNAGIGHLNEREILYVIDPHSASKNHTANIKQIEGDRLNYNQFLKVAYEESLKLLGEKNIPYVLYRGEFSNIRGGMKVGPVERSGLITLLTHRLDSVKEKVLERLKQANILDLK